MKWEDALKWLEAESNNNVEEQDNGETIESSSSYETCLISKERIKHNITLKCGHSFDYYNLFQELSCNQVAYYYHMCPYCRQHHDNFIPFYDINEMENITPRWYNYFRNDYYTCGHIFCNGKKKGTVCGKHAHLWNGQIRCLTHKPKEKKMTKYKIRKEVSRCTCKKSDGTPCKNYVSKKYNMNDDQPGLCSMHYKKFYANAD
jgi:hypothetical protein